MNKFKHLPVGQGGFYIGKLESGFNFVYDCGSMSHKSNEYLDKVINSEFSMNDEIDVLFLSHLHKDHVSGLEKLESKCRIKQMVLPYLGDDPFFRKISSIIQSEDLDFFKSISEIREIPYEEVHDKTNNENGVWINDYFVNFEYRTGYKEIDGLIFQWMNKSIDKKTILNISKDLLIELNGKSVEDYIKLNGLEVLKRIYEKWIGNLNISNTILIHYPKNTNEYSLLTGDAEFDSVLYDWCLKIIGKENIKYFQVPHHGSKADWKKMGDLRLKGEKYYISFGLGYRAGHPSAPLLKELEDNNKEINLCNQLCECEYEVK